MQLPAKSTPGEGVDERCIPSQHDGAREPILVGLSTEYVLPTFCVNAVFTCFVFASLFHVATNVLVQRRRLRPKHSSLGMHEQEGSGDGGSSRSWGLRWPRSSLPPVVKHSRE